MTPHSVPTVTFHRQCEGFAADRGAWWKALRNMGPVVRVRDSGSFYITGRADLLTALHDQETFGPWQTTFASPAFQGRVRPVPIVSGPADHRRIAKVLHPIFSGPRLARFEAALRGYAATLVDAIASWGSCEVTVAVGDGYACRALLRVLGLPSDDQVVGQVVALITHAETVDEYPLLVCLLTLAHQHLSGGGQPGGISPLFDAFERGDITQEEISGLLILLFIAGTETVTRTIWFALLRLALDAPLRAALVAEPEQIATFVEEIVRLEPANPTNVRVTTREVEIAGIPIPAGVWLWLCHEAVDRADGGDEVSLARGKPRHLAYGAGVHRCVGAALARMELKAFISAWLDKIPEFEVEPGFIPKTIFDARDLARPSAVPLRWGTNGASREDGGEP